jgi:two-component system KDP operon response regulator KdpE
MPESALVDDAVHLEEVITISRYSMSVKILIVEDDPDTAKGLAVRQKSNGFVVVQAMTAVSAMVLARAEEPDVIVLDLGLPDLDGYSPMKQLKQFSLTACIPVIVLAARDHRGNQECSYEISAFDFFQKPVIDKDILATIDRALASRLPKKSAESL